VAKLGKHARPYQTRYYIESEGYSSKPVHKYGYAASFDNAKRNSAMRLIVEQYGAAVICNRNSGHDLLVLKRTEHSIRLIGETHEAK
jgi:hypothetical protein